MKKIKSLENVSDLELLEILSSSNSSSAQFEFFSRYSSFLLSICQKRCSNFDDGNQLAQDIFQNTMIKAYEHSNSLFEKLTSKETNVPTRIKAWLSLIARNEFINFLRQNPDELSLSNQFRLKSHSLEDVHFEEDKKTFASSVESIYQKKSLDLALNQLSEKEKTVLLTSMEYYDPNAPKKHLPDFVIQSLCIKYKTTPGNLRSIKSRALKKLRDKLT